MSYTLSLLILIPYVGAAAVLLLGRTDRRMGLILTIFTSVVVLALALYSFGSLLANIPPIGQYALVEKYAWVSTPSFSFDYLLGLDGLSLPLIFVSALLTLFITIGSRNLIAERQAEFYALVLFFEGSIMGAFASLNLIGFYIFWELVLIPMFFLIGIWGADRRRYAAMKFMIFTFAGSTIMLLGFLAVYLGVSPHTFDIPELAGKVPLGLQYLPLLATFIGFGVKLPVVPLHSWLPDAYVQAPAPVSALLSGVLSKMAGYGFIRISIGLFPQASHTYAWVFMAIGLISMFYGAIVALLAKDLKRMISFTSINHMGFVVFGTFATAATGNLLGIEGAIFLMFAHALVTGSLFMLTGYIKERAGTTEIAMLKGLKNTMPRAAGLLVLASGAAIGLPPFASFLAEFMVLASGISTYSISAQYWVFATAILVPVITAGYFLWMIKRAILTPSEKGVAVNDLPTLDYVTLVFYLLPLVVLLVFSYLIINPAAPVAQWAAHLWSGS